MSRLKCSRAARLAGGLTAALAFAGCASYRALMDSGALRTGDGNPKMDLLALRQLQITDCGVASLVAVMSAWGVEATQAEVKAALGAPGPDGYLIEDFRRYAESQGFLALALEGSLQLLKTQCDAGRPCMVVVQERAGGNHSLVVTQVTQDARGAYRLRYMDPGRGKWRKATGTDFDARWEPLRRPLLLLGRSEPAEAGPAPSRAAQSSPTEPAPELDK